MSKRNFLSIALGIAAAASLALANAALAAEELGRVSAVAGEATAQQPGAEPRALACGDPVFAGDTLRTGPNSHVGVQLDDVAAHLDANSELAIGRTADNTPSARLLAGKVRMIDPRKEGPPAELAALDTDARVMSNDAEAYILSEKLGRYAMMCEWDSPLPVSRGKEQKTAQPNECVIAKPKEPLYTANAHEARIPALAQECAPGPELASLNDPRHHLSPADVAAPGPMAAAFVPPAPAPEAAYVCDQAAVCSPVIPIQAVEPRPNVEDPCAFGFCNPGQQSAEPFEPPKVEPPKAEPPKAELPTEPPVTLLEKLGPPPFANNLPAPPVADVPVFTDTPPAPPVKDAPPYQPPPSFPPKA
jgi:hypothetical protein